MEVIREAIVVDNNDPDKKGKVKVRIVPDMLEFRESDLPWIGIYSISNGTTIDYGKHNVLENGSNIRVIVEDYPFFKKIRYITDDYVEGLYFYDKIAGLSIAELGTQTYPQPSFHIYKDGTIDFHNSETGEHGTFFKNGGYTLTDSNGNFFINSKDKKIKFYNSLYTLKDILKDFQSILLNLVTPLNFVDGNGLPCTYAQASLDLPKINQALVKLNALMED